MQYQGISVMRGDYTVSMLDLLKCDKHNYKKFIISLLTLLTIIKMVHIFLIFSYVMMQNRKSAMILKE